MALQFIVTQPQQMLISDKLGKREPKSREFPTEQGKSEEVVVIIAVVCNTWILSLGGKKGESESAIMYCLFNLLRHHHDLLSSRRIEQTEAQNDQIFRQRQKIRKGCVVVAILLYSAFASIPAGKYGDRRVRYQAFALISHLILANCRACDIELR